MADLPFMALLEEPVAAAIFYIFQGHLQKHGVYFVYDFGGGTFDVTVISYNNQGIYVLAKDGLTDTGGKELDESIMTRILQVMKEEIPGIEPTSWDLLQLRKEAEKIKILLSEPDTYFLYRQISVNTWQRNMLFNRLEFESSIRPQVLKTLEASRRCLR